VPEENRERKSHAVREMIKMLGAEESSRFHVAVLKYYIDTEPYSTSALTVSQTSTPNLHQTPNGFECDAFFLPEMLRPQERQGKEVVNGVIRVRLNVKLDGILGIFAVAENGETIPFLKVNWVNAKKEGAP
jgi:hypothetical protein